MPDIATLLASAAVAALVTLFVEYLAKPGLEARKDRILEADRGRRQALAVLRAALTDLGAACSSSQDDEHADDRVRSVLSGARDQSRERLGRRGPELRDLFPAFIIGMKPEVAQFLGHTAGYLSSIHLLESPVVDPRSVEILLLTSCRLLENPRPSPGRRLARTVARKVLEDASNGIDAADSVGHRASRGLREG